MREMTPAEIESALAHAKWATLCTVSPEQTPYAIEATPFRDGTDLCFMINPRGRTWHNLQYNSNVLVKITLANRNLTWWAGVSCFGRGHFDTNPDSIFRGFGLLGEVVGTDYTELGRRLSRHPERSPLLRVKILERTGRCSAMVGEPLRFDIHA